jgi:hypothetical protein
VANRRSEASRHISSRGQPEGLHKSKGKRLGALLALTATMKLAVIHSALVLCTFTLLTRAATAGPKLGVDLDLAVPVSMNGVKTGFGGALRAGYDVDLVLVHVMPEVGIGLNKLSGDVGPLVMRGFAGGRIGVGALVRFDLFAHIGYAHVGYTNRPVGGDRDGYGTPVFDTGLALEVTALPVLDVGIHGSYNSAFNSNGSADAPKWLGLGAHVAVAF